MSSVFDRDDVNKAIGLAASCLYRLRAVEARANKAVREFVHGIAMFS